MAEHNTARLWMMRACYLMLGVLVIFFHLLPLETAPSRWAGPDLVLALTFSWALRRPEYVPTLSVAAIFLLADFLFQRPPGLYTALVLVATEWLKSRERRHRDISFIVELASVGLVMVLLTAGYRLALLIVIVDPGPLFLAVMQVTITLIVYPVVVLISRLVFGIRRAAPGELDSLGQRL